MDTHTTSKDPRTYSILGAAMEVHRELGSGFLEPVYHEALAIEFADRGIPFQHEPELPICYKAQPLTAKYRADFICYDSVVLELKALSTLTQGHTAQLINYLKATGLQTGLLINFGTDSLQYKRLIRSD